MNWDHLVNAAIILGTIVDPDTLKNPYPNEHAARLRNPGDFKEKPDWSSGGKFRRTKGGTIFGRIKVPATVSVIWGQLKSQSGRAAAPQTLRFPTANWTADQARKWLKDNKVTPIRFEPAAPKKAEAGPEPDPDPAPQSQTWFKIEAQAGGGTRIDIYDAIGAFGVSASAFVNQFNKIKSSSIELHIDSPGGVVHHGMAIYNNLKNSGKNIHVFIDGMAASMGSVIAMAGDKITMPDNALLMIHNPQGVQIGDAEAMRKEAELLDKIRGQIAQVYADRSGKTVDEIQSKMDAETWFTGKEALEFGLVDENQGQVKRAAHYTLDGCDFKNLDKLLTFMNISNQIEPKNQPKQNGGPEMEPKTVAELKAKYPELTAQLEDTVRETLNAEAETALKNAEETGAKNERERLAGIMSIPATGDAAKKIIDSALKDPKETKESVAVKLLEAQGKGEKIQIENRAADNQPVIDQVATIDKAPANTPDEDKQDAEEAKAAAIAAGIARPDIMAATRN